MVLFYFVLGSLIVWTVVFLSPWQPWRTTEKWDPSDHSENPADLGDITVLIPARNESKVIASTVDAVSRQGEGMHIVIVDDNSTDNTAAIARESGGNYVEIVSGERVEWQTLGA